MSEYRKRPVTSSTSQASQLNPIEDLEDSDKRKNKFENIYDQLGKLKDPFNNADKHKKALVYIQELYRIIILKFDDTQVKLELINACFSFNFPLILCNLIKKSYNKLKQCLENDLDPNKNAMANCDLLIRTFSEYSQLSARFIKEAYANDIVNTLFGFLKSEVVFDWLMDPAETLKSARAELIALVMDALVNLARLSSSFIDRWDAVDAVQTLIKISAKPKITDDSHLFLCIILANIASENEINSLKEMNNVIKEITKMIGKIAANIKNPSELRRIRINIEKDSNESHEIAATRFKNGILFQFFELANALYHMACNDTIKFEIYETHKMRSHLADIIEHGNEVEQEYALKILWQLCFNDRVSRDVGANSKLVEKIKKIASSKIAEGNVRPGLVRNCEGIVWQVERKIAKQIMISYNRESRELCLNIKKEVEAMGYQVWIDVNDMRDSCLDAMARAIENSMCVLLCVTEEYKLSTFCRSEAEYVYTRQRPFVPLMLQKNYKPDGWLGIILGQKVHIDFTKYEFKDSISRLSREIKNIQKSLDIPITQSVAVSNVRGVLSLVETKRKEGEKLEWTSEQVERWFDEKKISPAIVASITPCNGRVLYQLHTIESKATEYFYNSMFSDPKSSLMEVIHFAIELKELFG